MKADKSAFRNFFPVRLFLQFTGQVTFRASILAAYNYLSTLPIWLRKQIWAYVFVLIFFLNIGSWSFYVLPQSPSLCTYLLKVKRMTLIKQVANKSFPCYTSPRLPLAYCHF